MKNKLISKLDYQEKLTQAFKLRKIFIRFKIIMVISLYRSRFETVDTTNGICLFH